MTRLTTAVVLLVAVLTAGLVGPPSPAGAAPARAERIDWIGANWAAGVQMYDSEPSATDPYLHARFKRVGGDGQRKVRIGERWWKPDQKRWSGYHYSKPVRLAVGDKVVFTTEHALPCEPAKRPVGMVLQMRIKPAGKDWKPWVTWSSVDQILLDCTAMPVTS
ncbi:MAG TPA: hypothetical protein PLZ93_13865 [Nocardioides sp.]|uniref:hypothetical protein n=1 Tax=uncultured Nocardioides sp. TaxID=198441 RepID=UPI00260A281A|nr:hypothetical protein [uncultured Nocardioides sp.]HRD62197.1 hypothetical protein [Nocardioides sp.]HRI96697.1 hypothetical protein [Nocardioides sp.]HRK46726.1 hypothetical protein [Nocardioides sp.]